jgi:ornithine--oxo-acid transaminase
MLHPGASPLTTRYTHQPSALTESAISRESAYLAHNYHPLPVVAKKAKAQWVWDIEGKKYLDCLAAYSALNFGHQHPTIVRALRKQLKSLSLTSRAMHNDQLGPFAEELCELVGHDMVLPMNTGAEAVETALKIARAWGYRSKGVPENKATIIVADNNFHGRTLGIVSFSSDPVAREDFGPFLPGFKSVPYGDSAALESAIDETTVAVLLEPIQGEAGIVIPPSEYLPEVRRITRAHNVLMIADEIQSGLGRTGATLQVDNVGVTPDMVTLGKALGGGVLPVSAVVGRSDVLGVIQPGQHGSTFGGNPLAAAVGRAVVGLLAPGDLQRRARVLGEQMAERLKDMESLGVVGVRQAGLWAGVDVDPALATGREVAEALVSRGVLTKDTHGSTLRFAPPLVVTERDVAFAMDQLSSAMKELARSRQ